MDENRILASLIAAHLMHDLNGRSGFSLAGINTDIKIEWLAEWETIIYNFLNGNK